MHQCNAVYSKQDGILEYFENVDIYLTSIYISGINHNNLHGSIYASCSPVYSTIILCMQVGTAVHYLI